MKLWKSSMLFLGVAILILSSLSVCAETESDTQGDVWHFIYPYWQTQTIENKPNVDIKEISADISGDQITLSITLWPGGAFERSEYDAAVYVMFYNTSDAYYWMTYVDAVEQEEPVGLAWGILLEGGGLPAIGEVTVNDNILSSTLNITGEDTTALEFYGTAWLWEKYGTAEQYTGEQWVDWVGDYEFTGEIDPGDGDGDGDGNGNGGGDGNGDGDGDGTTPGFEALALIAAVAIALIILRRRK